MKWIMYLLLCFAATACYRMPEDGEVSTVPNINNPSMTGNDKSSAMPASPNVDF